MNWQLFFLEKGIRAFRTIMEESNVTSIREVFEQHSNFLRHVMGKLVEDNLPPAINVEHGLKRLEAKLSDVEDYECFRRYLLTWQYSFARLKRLSKLLYSQNNLAHADCLVLLEYNLNSDEVVNLIEGLYQELPICPSCVDTVLYWNETIKRLKMKI